MNAYECCNGIQQAENVAKDMEAVSQKEGEWKTRWTVVYQYTDSDSENLAVTVFRFALKIGVYIDFGNTLDLLFNECSV